MRPLFPQEADFSTESLRDELESRMDKAPEIEAAAEEFNRNFDIVFKRLLESGHEEYIAAMLALEIAHNEEIARLFDNLVNAFLGGASTDEPLPHDEELQPKRDYEFLQRVIRNLSDQSIGNKTASPPSREY